MGRRPSGAQGHGSAVGCGRLSAAGCVEGLWPPIGGGLCRRVVFAGAQGEGIAFGDEYKVNVTRFTFPPPTVILNEVKDLGTRR